MSLGLIGVWRMRLERAGWMTAVVTALGIAPVSGQQLDSLAPRGRPMLTGGDAIVGAAFVTGSVVAAPFDRRLAVALQRPSLQSSSVLHDAATTFRVLGSPGAVVAGPALYLIGRLAHSPRVADLGLHGTETVAAAAAVTLIAKGLLGRARPYAVGDTMPGSFGFARGFSRGSSYSSLPSGHTAVAFAAAAVVTSETSRWWPHSARYVGPAMYGGATLVGLSRLYNNQHWGSDIVAAAGVGILCERVLAPWQHPRVRGAPASATATRSSLAVLPLPGEVLFVWSLRL